MNAGVQQLRPGGRGAGWRGRGDGALLQLHGGQHKRPAHRAGELAVLLEVVYQGVLLAEQVDAELLKRLGVLGQRSHGKAPGMQEDLSVDVPGCDIHQLRRAVILVGDGDVVHSVHIAPKTQQSGHKSFGPWIQQVLQHVLTPLTAEVLADLELGGCDARALRPTDHPEWQSQGLQIRKCALNCSNVVSPVSCQKDGAKKIHSPTNTWDMLDGVFGKEFTAA
mmetsp:Transcript_32840/g.82464  ORF Transcript_32840/g.82464 Transcript_32840/m.82464 type:complete len:222 (-) Transcript_32840:331-996(-)|eukprot:CAMPEP_0177636056 /NCGR_PEP_ID=MMETSP0447-20121125/4231_1 /TAXON_ID=0 /ORGANISM="Stygamoeba regulata, Strain BSH-02190019" /LENGTH=221 /DNA_ID=CAMNT_0019137885 /DNA_START=180 /DNA_END=845 /DNA_ORIENTATION=+